MNIKDCIIKFKLDSVQSDQIMQDYKEYIASGMSVEKAKDLAIEDHYDRLMDEKESIIDKIRKYIPNFGAELKALTKKEPETKKHSFQETKEPVSEKDYIEYETIGDDTYTFGLKKWLADSGREIKKGLDKYLGATHTRLLKIDSELASKYREIDYKTSIEIQKNSKIVERMMKKVEKTMSKKDHKKWDYARHNSDIDTIYQLVEKYNFTKEYNASRRVLDTLSKTLYDIGVLHKMRKNHWPRVLKDSRGFLEAINKHPDWPVFSKAIKEVQAQSQKELTKDQEAKIINNILQGTHHFGNKYSKQRKLEKVPADLMKYYMSPNEAMMAHIVSANKVIQAKKFFGVDSKKIKLLRKRLKFAKTEEDINLLNTELDKFINQEDFTENIGNYILELKTKKNITPAQENEIRDILTARFHETGGPTGIVQDYKNLSYIDTMGSATSAITQIGDLAFSAYKFGLLSTGKHLYKAIRGKAGISVTDIGVDRIAQEFTDSGRIAKALETVFKLTGLQKIDKIGKETLINAALEDLQKKAKKSPKELRLKIKAILGSEADAAISDLQDGNNTENVGLLVYGKLLDFQPVGLSEMPEAYLKMKNGRIFYMLKTYTIKMFDVYRREIVQEIAKGNVEKGLTNAVKLGAFLMLCNATADEIKDWMLGRETDFNDQVMDNIYRLAGVSKFITWQARTEGAGTAIAKQILPPFKFIDSAGKDFFSAGDEKGLSMIGSIPLIGKFYYWHAGRGTHKKDDLWDRRLSKRTKKLKQVDEKFQKAENKLQFNLKHASEIKELRENKKIKSKVGKLRRRINKLKSFPETSTRAAMITRLEDKRVDIIKAYLD